MQAVILAAGEGRRLRPLTHDLPKPLVPIGAKPILEYSISILPPAIDEVILVVGYFGEKIKEYFGASFGGKSIKYAHQPELKGTADALGRAKPFLRNGHFLMLYGDDLYHPEDLENCVKQNAPAVLVKESKNPERFGVCLIDDNGCLKEILEKQENPPSNLVNIGVYLLNHEIFDIPMMMLPNGEYNLALQIGAWAKRRRIRVVKARFLHPIGYPEDVIRAEYFLNLPLSEMAN